MGIAIDKKFISSLKEPEYQLVEREVIGTLRYGNVLYRLLTRPSQLTSNISSCIIAGSYRHGETQVFIEEALALGSNFLIRYTNSFGKIMVWEVRDDE
jgi:hypothetical protein